jgi:hypothetical protein
MFQTEVQIADQKFQVGHKTFAEFFEALVEVGEINYRIQDAKRIRWNVRRLKKDGKVMKFYELIGYIKHENESYRVTIAFGQRNDKKSPFSFYIKSTTKWVWYDHDSQKKYEYHGPEEGFILVGG